MLLKKIYSDFGGGKKKSDSELLSYNLMLNSGKKIRATKKINILTLVLSEKKILNETKKQIRYLTMSSILNKSIDKIEMEDLDKGKSP